MADWDERYRKGEHAPEEPHQLLVQAVGSLAPGRALDVACGAGRHAIFLARKNWDVTAVDSSAVGLELAQKRALADGVSINTVIADLEHGAFQVLPSAYNLICDFYYLQRDLFPAIKDGLQPGGTFVAAIHIVDDEDDACSMNPNFLLNPGELEMLFRDWNIDHYREGRRDGLEHKHRDAEIIARKP